MPGGILAYRHVKICEVTFFSNHLTGLSHQNLVPFQEGVNEINRLATNITDYRQNEEKITD